MERAVGEARWQLVSISLSAGLKVEEILVVGRNETKREDLLKAIRVARDMPILAAHVEALRRLNGHDERRRYLSAAGNRG